jgi:outer membrane murein-binding lipoprotein Lpp
VKKRLLLVLAAVVFLLSITLAGCQSGVTQESYDQVAAQVLEAKEIVEQANKQIADLVAQLKEAASQLKTAQDKNTELEGQVSDLNKQVGDLKEKYELTGATPTETAEKIIKYYHETHVYDVYDLFVCSDMSAEVWNMLKAQGINALMAVGAPDAPKLNDIALCNHAWVLAEIAPGEYLALETTGGYSVDRKSNGGYYRGWTFNTPADIKKYQQLIIEYNTKVDLRNKLSSEADIALNQYNQSSGQAEADEYLAVYRKLSELRSEQEEDLLSIRAEFEGLATEF